MKWWPTLCTSLYVGWRECINVNKQTKTPAVDQQLQTRWLFKCPLYWFHHLAKWGIADRLEVGPDRGSIHGCDSNPQVSNNETPCYRQGSSHPSWAVISGEGCCHRLRRRPAASPAPAWSSATRWKEWSRERSAVNKIFTRQWKSELLLRKSVLDKVI